MENLTPDETETEARPDEKRVSISLVKLSKLYKEANNCFLFWAVLQLLLFVFYKFLGGYWIGKILFWYFQYAMTLFIWQEVIAVWGMHWMVKNWERKVQGLVKP